jgi:hypothetical protein
VNAPSTAHSAPAYFSEIDRVLTSIEQRLAQIRHQASATQQEPQRAGASAPLTLARKAYHERRRRDQVFLGIGIFGEPAWDILLDLFIARETGANIAVSSACIAAAAPGTTALRYIEALHSRGLVERDPDPDDRRRIWLRLSDRGYRLMLGCLG